MSDPIPPELVQYLVERDRERAETREAAVAAMTRDERQLLHDAAVMGFVHGTQYGSVHPYDLDDFPKDAAIVARVLDACAVEHGGYPFLTQLMKHGRREPTWRDVTRAMRAAGVKLRSSSVAGDTWRTWEILTYLVSADRWDYLGGIERAPDGTWAVELIGHRHNIDLTNPTPADVLIAGQLCGLVDRAPTAETD